MASSKAGTVKWDDETKQTGMLISESGSQTRIYSPQRAISETVYEELRDLIMTPIEWKAKSTRRDQAVRRIYPTDLAYAFGPRIIESAKKHASALLDEALTKVELKDMSVPDAIFLAKLGKTRNWRSGCVICLTEDIMGTTCGCGHTEIVVFRPCGHAICVRPCFAQWTNHAGVNVDRKTITWNGVTFYVGQELDVNLNHPNLQCPTCRSPIERTFRAEESIGLRTLDADVKRLVNEISTSLNLPSE